MFVQQILRFAEDRNQTMYVLQRHVWSPQRLFQMLEDCLSREREYWRKNPLLENSDQVRMQWLL